MGRESLANAYSVAEGHAILNSDAWSGLADSLKLSRREVQITQAVFDDEHENQIAQRLGVSIHTVHTHLERLYHKLDVHSRTQLVVRLVGSFHQLTVDPDSSLPSLCAHRATGRCPLAS